MRIGALGRASFAITSGDVTLLVDPLLHELHREGAHDVYPPRELELSNMPPVSGVVLSRAHLGSFDPASLGTIPREVPVIAVDDPVLVGALQGLGFGTIHRLDPFEEVTFGDLRIVGTPAGTRRPELGLLFVEGESVVWNMVETSPSPEEIRRVKGKHPKIDVAISPWQPVRDSAIGAPPTFPFEAYEEALRRIAHVAPAWLAAGVSGFRALAPYELTNHRLFPVTRERYVHDVAQLLPELGPRTLALDPGDALDVRGGEVSFERAALDYCKAAGPYRWEELAFRPYDLGAPVPEQDEGFTDEACGAAVAQLFSEALPEFIREHLDELDWHRRFGVLQQVEVVFSDRRRYWTIDFRAEEPFVREERSPLALGCTMVTASLLLRLVANMASVEHGIVSGQLRLYGHHYAVSRAGLLRPPPGALVDTLARMFGHDDSLTRVITSQITELVAASLSAEAATDPPHEAGGASGR